MFCLFSGNQFGLSGSKEFVGSLTSNNKIGNIINLDMIGYQDPEVSFNVGVFPTPNKFDFYDNFQKIQSLYVPKIELRSDATYKQANSDINNSHLSTSNIIKTDNLKDTSINQKTGDNDNTSSEKESISSSTNFHINNHGLTPVV